MLYPYYFERQLVVGLIVRLVYQHVYCVRNYVRFMTKLIDKTKKQSKQRRVELITLSQTHNNISIKLQIMFDSWLNWSTNLKKRKQSKQRRVELITLSQTHYNISIKLQIMFDSWLNWSTNLKKRKQSKQRRVELITLSQTHYNISIKFVNYHTLSYWTIST